MTFFLRNVDLLCSPR